MSDYSFECLHTYEEFLAVRDDWEEFTQSFCPESYGRTHAWLSAYWATYHHKRSALIYIQRKLPDGRIVAVAPIIVCKENFGGFPVHSVKMLGAGLGREEMLVCRDADGFLQELFSDLKRNYRWTVARFQRVRDVSIQNDFKAACLSMKFGCDTKITDDLIADLPVDYASYLQSKNSKFRSNLKLAEAKIEKMGKLSFSYFIVSDSRLDIDSLRESVATNSWQYRNGSSHFNDHGNSCMFENLRLHLSGTKEACTVFVLSIAEVPVAYMVCVINGKSCYFVDTAFNEKLANLSLGRIIFSRTIEHLIERGILVFDLEGGGAYKLLYANRFALVEEITIYNRSFYAWCIRLLRKSRLYAKLKEIINHAGKKAAINA